MEADGVRTSDGDPFDRLSLLFEPVALNGFLFLVTDVGFHVVESGPTYIRYERGDMFVEIFHGRRSYEVGVEFGRKVEINGVPAEQKFPLQALVRAAGGTELAGRAPTVTSADFMVRAVRHLADVAARYSGSLFGSPDTEFEQLSQRNGEWAKRYTEDIEASRLREKAQTAWRQEDWLTVVRSYQRILDELSSVSLKPSEIKKLAWAVRQGRGDR